MKYWENTIVNGIFTKSIREITATYIPTKELRKSGLRILRVDGGCSCGGKLVPVITIGEDFTIKATFKLTKNNKPKDNKIIIVYYSNGDREFLNFNYEQLI